MTKCTCPPRFCYYRANCRKSRQLPALPYLTDIRIALLEKRNAEITAELPAVQHQRQRRAMINAQTAIRRAIAGLKR